MRPLHSPLSRRTTLVAAPLTVLAACEWGPDEPAPLPRPGAPDEAAVDDATHATEALALTAYVAELVATVAARHVGLSTPLASLTAVHLAHSALLAEAATPSGAPSPPPVPPGSRRALALVVREERRLEERLAELVEEVASGGFARALASMSASIAQHVAVLPDGSRDGRP